MSKIVNWFKKFLLVAVIAALGLASLPALSVYALGQADPSTPTPQTVSTDRLQTAWAREQAIYSRLDTMFGKVDAHIARIQQLIDKAKANGKDVSAVQSALDAFSAAVKQAKPIFDSMHGIMSSHPGFDANGNVTDATTALQTVKDVRSQFKQIHDTMNGTGKALHQAIQAFRQANQPTAAPAQSGG